MDKEEVREKIINATSGVVATVSDLAMFFLLIGITPNTNYGSISMRKHINGVTEEMESIGIDRETVKRAIWKLTHKKYIRRKLKGDFELTESGENRIGQTITLYKKNRPWDGSLYLITYDIPEKRKNDRDKLRSFLKRNNLGLLQDSVWFSLLNPTKIIKEYSEKNKLRGTIIVSSLGREGSVGEEDLDDLLTRIYGLNNLNKRYQELIELIRAKKIARKDMALSLYLILKDDPQLPFELLPYNWVGDKCYRLVNSSLKH